MTDVVDQGSQSLHVNRYTTLLKKALFYSLLGFSFPSSAANADTLQQIFDLARSNDPQIRAAEARLNADLNKRSLGRAGLLPQVSLSGTYTDTTISPDNSQDIDIDFKSYTARMNQAVFDLPAWYEYKRGDAETQQAEQDYLAAQQDLIIRTATAYFNTLGSLDTMQVTKAEEVALASQLEQTKQRYEVGLIAVTDVHEAQAAYDDVVARLVGALGAVGIAFENLTVLTNQQHLNIAPLREAFPIADPAPALAEDWVKMALANSFELKSTTLARDASRHNAQSKKWEHLPSLNLGLSYTKDDSRNLGGTQFVLPGSETTSVLLSMDMPLYFGGSISASRRQAHYEYLTTEETMNEVRRSLMQNTRNQHLRVRTKIAEINARRQAITSSESAYEATRAGYDAGTRNLVDVLNAEQTLYRARRNYSTARYDYILDLFTLNQLAGSLTSENLSDLDQWLDTANQTPKSLVELSLPGMPLPRQAREGSPAGK